MSSINYIGTRGDYVQLKKASLILVAGESILPIYSQKLKFRNIRVWLYTYFQWTEDRQGFQIQYLTLDTLPRSLG